MPPAVDGIGEIAVCGDDLLTVTVDDTPLAQRLADTLRASGAWLEVVAGLQSVVVQFDAAHQSVDAAIRELEAGLETVPPAADGAVEEVEIPVLYGGDDGPDFDAVCEQLGLSADELIALHTAGHYRVDLIGFTPGFAFIGGLDAKLDLPRRAEPRARVAPGSVGIAGGRTGLYALGVPGGWSLIGRTPLKLFDASAEPPNTLQPGMRVRFRAVSR